MTALPAFSDDLPSERRMRSRWLRPDDAPPPLLPWPPPFALASSVYTSDAPALPFPEAARPYLRADAAGPMAHWASIVSSLAQELCNLPTGHPRIAPLRALMRYLERPGAIASAGAAERVLALLPLSSCDVCRAPFWRENDRRRYCSDDCRRDAAEPDSGILHRERRRRPA